MSGNLDRVRPAKGQIQSRKGFDVFESKFKYSTGKSSDVFERATTSIQGTAKEKYKAERGSDVFESEFR